MEKETQEITVYKINEWNSWLKKNHLKEKKVGLISYKKHTGKDSISHKEAMDEAICFGWIDTTMKKLDEERYIRYFVKRGENANWSKNTLSYGKKLLEEGRMSPFGIKRYKEGLKKKPHDHDIPENPDIPSELEEALNKNKKAKENFEKFPPSTKKMLYRWIIRAKQTETKMKRVNKIIQQASEGKKEIF